MTFGFHRQGARDGHALLLAARQLARILVGLLPDAHPRQQVARTLFRRGGRSAAHAHRGEHHIAQHGQVRKEVEGLEHHADIGPDLFKRCGHAPRWCRPR
jgi:hypothetical protein